MPFVAAIPALALAVSAVSAGVGAYSAYSSGQAQSQAAHYQAQVAANNQTVANQNATLAGQQADAKVQADYRAGAIRMGAQRAALGANGGTLDGGSAAAVQQTTAESTQLGANNDAYQGSLQQYSLRSQGTNFGAQAQLDTMQAGNASTAGLVGAAGSIIGGGSQFASRWDSYYRGSTPDTSEDWSSLKQT